MTRMSSHRPSQRAAARQKRSTLLRLVAAVAVITLVLGVTLLQLTNSTSSRSSNSNSNPNNNLSPAHLLRTQRLLLRSELRKEEDNKRALKKKDSEHKHKHKDKTPEAVVPATEAAVVEEDMTDGADEDGTLVDPTEAIIDPTEAIIDPTEAVAATEAKEKQVPPTPVATEAPKKKHAKNGSDLLVPTVEKESPVANYRNLESKTFRMDLEALVPRDGHVKTKGRVTIVTHPEWAPLGAQHFHELVEAGFYNDCRFFRVVNDFMVQFGINGDPKVQKEWKAIVLKDDPVLHTNARATLSFATSGANTRTTQLFINTRADGNKFLDNQGFSPFAEITVGMEYVDHIYAEYGEKPSQGKINKEGNAYLEEKYPLLSYITHIYEEEKEEAEEAT